MWHIKKITVVFTVALLVLASRTARADAFDQSMILTFSAAVEVPGVVLPAGTYQFKLANPATGGSAVEILSADGSQAYALLLTTPDSRPTPTDKPAVRFEERAAASPDAIRAIFYTGETIGREFKYQG